MPGITNPAELYFKNGLWAWDVAEKTWKRCENDPTTNQVQVAVTNDAEVHQDTPGDLLVGAHGWDGAAWRKLPLVWGYYNRWLNDLSGTKDGDGVYDAPTTAVPAGSVYVLECISIRNKTRAPSKIEASIVSGGETYVIAVDTTPAQWIPLVYSSRLTLKEGDQIAISVEGCLDNDVLVGAAWGYEMKIAE